MINIKYCKLCGGAYDMETNFDICPRCREKEIEKINKEEENGKG